MDSIENRNRGRSSRLFEIKIATDQRNQYMRTSLLKCKAFITALVLDPRFCFTSGHQLLNTEMLIRGIIESQKC